MRRVVIATVLAALLAGSAVASAAPPPWVWRVAGGLDPGVALALACPSRSLCVGVDAHGSVLASRTPAAGARGWSRTTVAGSPAFTSIACPSTAVCLAGDSTGQVWTLTAPGTAPVTATPVTVDPGKSIVGLACPSATLCVAAAGDDLAVSKAPGGASWQLYSNVDQTQDYECVKNVGTNCGVALIGVSCASSAWCAAYDSGGGGAGGDPRAGFTPQGGSAGGESILGGACLPAGGCFSLCGVGEGATGEQCPGDTYGATALCGAPPGCYQLSAQPQYGLFCPARSLCLTPDGAGDLLESTDPADRSTWRVVLHQPMTVDFRPAVAIACPALDLCVATDAAGRLLLGAPPPRAQELARALRRALTRATPKRIVLLSSDRYRCTVASPSASRLTVRWSVRNRDAEHRTRTVLIAAGAVAFDASGQRTLTVTLNRRGRALLRADGRLRIEVTATLAGATARPLRLAGAFVAI